MTANALVLAADSVLVCHFLLAAFIVIGLALVWTGAAFDWDWVRNFWLRAIHAAAIGVVALESAVGLACPLTLWENRLRGDFTHASFIGHWVQRLLYYDFPEPVFALAYLIFLGAVVLTWYRVPPKRRVRV